MGPWMQGREVPRRALSASVGESSLELQLSNSLELGCILSRWRREFGNCSVARSVV